MIAEDLMLGKTLRPCELDIVRIGLVDHITAEPHHQARCLQ